MNIVTVSVFNPLDVAGLSNYLLVRSEVPRRNSIHVVVEPIQVTVEATVCASHSGCASARSCGSWRAAQSQPSAR